jgi:hypothetical protein
VWAELFHADGQADKMLIVAIRSFSKAAINASISLRSANQFDMSQGTL